MGLGAASQAGLGRFDGRLLAGEREAEAGILGWLRGWPLKRKGRSYCMYASSVPGAKPQGSPHNLQREPSAITNQSSPPSLVVMS
jgi:hypothetical protein